MKKILWLIIMVIVTGGLVFSPAFFYANAQIKLIQVSPPDNVDDDGDDHPKDREEVPTQKPEQQETLKVSDLAIYPTDVEGLIQEVTQQLTKDSGLAGQEFPSESISERD